MVKDSLPIHDSFINTLLHFHFHQHYSNTTTARKRQSATNYVLYTFYFLLFVYPSIFELMHLMVLFPQSYQYKFQSSRLIHLRNIIIHHVTTKYQNKVDMKGLIVLKLMKCQNNSTIILFTQRYKFPVHGSGDTVT